MSLDPACAFDAVEIGKANLHVVTGGAVLIYPGLVKHHTLGNHALSSERTDFRAGIERPDQQEERRGRGAHEEHEQRVIKSLLEATHRRLPAHRCSHAPRRMLVRVPISALRTLVPLTPCPSTRRSGAACCVASCRPFAS